MRAHASSLSRRALAGGPARTVTINAPLPAGVACSTTTSSSHPSGGRRLGRSTADSVPRHDQSRLQQNPRFFSSNNPSNLPSSADVVIVGGGSAGASTFFHLAKLFKERGESKKVVLVDKNELTSGTTWHSAGLCWHLYGSDVEMQLVMYASEFLQNGMPAIPFCKKSDAY